MISDLENSQIIDLIGNITLADAKKINDWLTKLGSNKNGGVAIFIAKVCVGD